MSTHPFDLERRALVAYKRRTGRHLVTGAYCTTLGAELLVIVTRMGQAIAAYALQANGRLRHLEKIPEAIW